MSDYGGAKASQDGTPRSEDAGDRDLRAAYRASAVTGKPAAESLGIDVDGLSWRRPGGTAPGGEGVMEVAMAHTDDGATWVLLRVTGDPASRVLVYDQHEWECFLDGVRNGEFDLPN